MSNRNTTGETITEEPTNSQKSEHVSTDVELDHHSVDGGDDARNPDVRTYLAWGALAVCSLLAVFALIRFYSSTTAAIDLWISSAYRPIVQAAFNLVVLLLALTGVSWLVRELA